LRKRLRNLVEATMATRPTRRKRLTIKEFAETLGVSTATVSRAIHGRGRISPETRARILAQMEQLGYTPNLHAQSLARQRSQAIALEYLGAVEVLADSFLVELARGVQTELVAHHYRLLLNLTGDREYRRSVLCQWVRARVVDGVILVGNPRVDPEWVDALQAENIPAVWIAYDVPQPLPPNVAVVQLDTSVGWREAVDALVAMGHRAFGYLGVDPNDVAIQAIHSALAQHGLQLPDSRIWLTRETPEGGFEAAVRILNTSPMPTALLVRTDLLAIGALQAFQQHGVRIPDDLSLVGHDDLPISRWLVPPLSTIRIDYTALGRAVVENMLQLLHQPKTPPPPVRIATRFHPRQTTAQPKSS
jgi:LacI family transcriptional regulator